MKNQEHKSALSKFIIPSGLFTEHGDVVTAQHGIIYAYMLARYNFFNSKNQKFFEGIEGLAENCFCGTTAVKKALKVLEDLGLVVRNTLKGSVGNRNYYIVVDKYNVGGEQKAEKYQQPVKRNFVQQIVDDEGCPF